MATDYSIWAFAYARSFMPRDFFGGTPIFSNQGRVRNPMVYTAILGGSAGERARPIVIDTGMRPGTLSMKGTTYRNFEAPERVLGKVGIDPAQVETVILTHLHFDHAGNTASFPKAQFYVQRREYEGWLRVLAAPDTVGKDRSYWKLSSLARDDIAEIQRLDADGRLVLLDGDREIAPGVVCRLAADTHTFGSQWVEVATKDGPYVVAGDCVYWYSNIERMWPPGYVQGDTWNILAAYERIRGLLGGRVDRIIPGHDPEIFTRHPSWKAGRNDVAEVHLAAGEATRRPGL